jgi:putative endonuclease
VKAVNSGSFVQRHYYVYIMANERHTIYTGVTNDLPRRVWQHKNKVVPGFTTRYDCTMLVYYEVTGEIRAAIEREKQIKGWLRRKKVELIMSLNPEWRDLSLDWDLPGDLAAAT